jgi:streptomycin 6-kinase
VAAAAERWSLAVGPPFETAASAAWVAPAELVDGTSVVLKIAWPHREARTEAAGLRFFDGRGAVRLIAADEEAYVLLEERCQPGDDLSTVPPAEGNQLAARVLRELWHPPAERGPFELLAELVAEWTEEFAGQRDEYPSWQRSLAAEVAGSLVEAQPESVVLHGDFNPGNVLAARRRPWLAIDAKPMIGDPGYDPWPLVAQIDEPFAHADPLRVLTERFALVADVVGEDVRRLAAWALAREVESALWAADHRQSPIAYGSMEKARVFARLAEV